MVETGSGVKLLTSWCKEGRERERKGRKEGGRERGGERGNGGRGGGEEQKREEGGKEEKKGCDPHTLHGMLFMIQLPSLHHCSLMTKPLTHKAVRILQIQTTTEGEVNKNGSVSQIHLGVKAKSIGFSTVDFSAVLINTMLTFQDRRNFCQCVETPLLFKNRVSLGMSAPLGTIWKTLHWVGLLSPL